MHVLYAGGDQFRHLINIFGADSFDLLEGYKVDIGASYNFGQLSTDSIYPDLRDHPSREIILAEILSGGRPAPPKNAHEAFTSRFGYEAGDRVATPIIEKLWKTSASELSPEAIHCFYDLRRIILCDKDQADELKKNQRLDLIIGNPKQSAPSGQVFGGRCGLLFRSKVDPFAEQVQIWLKDQGITIEYGAAVAVQDRELVLNGEPMSATFDGCIVTTPIGGLAPHMAEKLDLLELSVFYVRLAASVAETLPAYYVLCHSSDLAISRIVNYDTYHNTDKGILAVEVIHTVGTSPTNDEIIREIHRVIPRSSVEEVYRLPKTLGVAVPSLRNGRMLDAIVDGLEKSFEAGSLFFAGMRTDKGLFFSHQTMGAAHDAALECARRLS